MLIDTHCHINMLVKDSFDSLLTAGHMALAQKIVDEARDAGVTKIINVGTSLIESENCVKLAQIPQCYAAIGIHPNDVTQDWADDLKKMKSRWCSSDSQLAELKIVAIGECGLDYHYPNFDSSRQKDAFRAQIDLALRYDLALSIHTRDAGQETLAVLNEYRNESLRGVIHCFSEDQIFADHAREQGFSLGIGGTVTYPKNNQLRTIVSSVPLEGIVLETDAPFLPLQQMRGQKNHPKYISTLAHYITQLRHQPLDQIIDTIAATTNRIFRFNT